MLTQALSAGLLREIDTFFLKETNYVPAHATTVDGGEDDSTVDAFADMKATRFQSQPVSLP